MQNILSTIIPDAGKKVVESYVLGLSDAVGFRTLINHYHEVFITAAAYQFICVFASPALCRWFMPDTYAAFSEKLKVGWHVRFVSFVQSILVSVVGLWVMFYNEQYATMNRPENWAERVWGYTPTLGTVQALACGYFIWDLYISARYFKHFGAGALIHAVCALAVFSFGFFPFVNFYGPSFVLYELSSPFLNLGWFCIKAGATLQGLRDAKDEIARKNITKLEELTELEDISKLKEVIRIEKINRIKDINRIKLIKKSEHLANFLLLVSFFGCRMVWGNIATVRVIREIIKAYTSDKSAVFKNIAASVVGSPGVLAWVKSEADLHVPTWLAVVYIVSNVILNILSVFWMSAMFRSALKLLGPKSKKEKNEKNEKESSALADEATVLVSTGAEVN